MKQMKLLPAIALFVIANGTAAFKAAAQEKKEIVKEERVIKRESPGPPMEKGEGIAGLNEEQKKKMKEIHLRTEKDLMPLQNQVAEKRAHLKTLSTSDKPNMEEVNKTIDEMMVLKGSILKKEAASRQEIRSMLTDEQRIRFDKKKPGRGSKQVIKKPVPPAPPVMPKKVE